MKHFLRCSNCGHLNEITSEYMVFCSSCGKKMSDNFTEWQRRNPGNSFEDYKQKVGITVNQLPPEVPGKKKGPLKSRSSKEKILIVGIVALTAGIGVWLGNTAVRAIQAAMIAQKINTNTPIQDEQWEKKTYTSYGLTIEIPWELNKMQLPAEQLEALQQLVESMDMHESSDDKRFKILLSMFKYKPEIEFSLQGAALGTVNSLRNQPNVTNFVYDEKPYQLDAISGYKQEGSFQVQSDKLEFTSIGLYKENTYYQLMITTKANDETAKKAGQRVIDSIEIE